jgi:hypothetical protein
MIAIWSTGLSRPWDIAARPDGTYATPIQTTSHRDPR